MKDFHKKIAQAIAENDLIGPDNEIVVGLSGGADSVALLKALFDLDYKCSAAHCNFHLRGEESDRDEAFCRQLCERLNVELMVKHFDAKARMEQTGESVEMACRELRYNWWSELLIQNPMLRIVLGHHLDDDIETMFLQLLRGSGVDGLKGMVVKRGAFIRPMLGISKAEILEFIESEGLPYVTDSTNLSIDFMRNKVRNVLLPEIEKLFPGSRAALVRSLKILKDDFNLKADFLSSKSLKYGNLRGLGNSIRVSEIVKNEEHPSLVIFELLKDEGFTLSQAESMVDIMKGRDKGTSGYGQIFEADGEKYLLDRYSLVPYDENDTCRTCEVSFFEPPFSASLISYSEFESLKNEGQISKNCICFDGNVLKDDPRLILRPWRNGDRIQPFGMKGSKLVSDILSDAKLSLIDKQKVRILTRYGKILWVVGIRASCHYPVTPESEHILKVTYHPENE